MRTWGGSGSRDPSSIHNTIELSMMYVLSTIDYFMDMRPVSLLGTADGIMIQFDDVAVS